MLGPYLNFPLLIRWPPPYATASVPLVAKGFPESPLHPSPTNIRTHPPPFFLLPPHDLIIFSGVFFPMGFQKHDLSSFPSSVFFNSAFSAYHLTCLFILHFLTLLFCPRQGVTLPYDTPHIYIFLFNVQTHMSPPHCCRTVSFTFFGIAPPPLGTANSVL